MSPERVVDSQVLVASPTGRDGQLICGLLSKNGIQAAAGRDVGYITERLTETTGALVIAEEALVTQQAAQSLFEGLQGQPPWSDVPLILLMREGMSSGRAERLLRHDWAWGRGVLVVNRPVRRVAFVTVVSAALQERHHQYQLRDYLEEQKRKDDQLRHTQRLESIGILAGGVAHDFNNLLTGILGNASLALEDIPRGHRARIRIEGICGAAQRAADLTRQLLAYAGKGQFLVQSIDLSSLVSEMSKLIQLSIPKSVHLRLDLEEPLAAISADSSQVQQVIMNLIINGAEAIESGRDGLVLVRTGAQDVDQRYIQQTFAPTDPAPGRYVYLEVKDNGSGMDDEIKARIFDPFFTTKFTGRGLGLSAVLGIVRGHKGMLHIYSVKGQGSTFKVLFPAATTAAEPEVAGYQPGRGSGTVLVVDDEEIIQKVARTALERAGYLVKVACDGREALDKFQESAADVSLVLLDLTMPGMNGEETFRRLKSLRPSVSVILSSGYSEREVAERFAGKGLAGFIQKPYTSVALLEKVQSVLK